MRDCVSLKCSKIKTQMIYSNWPDMLLRTIIMIMPKLMSMKESKLTLPNLFSKICLLLTSIVAISMRSKWSWNKFWEKILIASDMIFGKALEKVRLSIQPIWKIHSKSMLKKKANCLSLFSSLNFQYGKNLDKLKQ